MRLGSNRYRAYLRARPLSPLGDNQTDQVDLGDRLSVDWGWVLNRTSTATVTVPLECHPDAVTMAKLGPAVELVVEREDTGQVWSGPVLTAARTPRRRDPQTGNTGTLRVGAADQSWWARGRYPGVIPAVVNDPAWLAEWAWVTGKNLDPWDRIQTTMVLTGEETIQEWGDTATLTTSDMLQRLDDLIRWRVINGRFDVAGLGGLSPSKLAPDMTRVTLNYDAWLEHPSDLTDWTDMVTRLSGYQDTDALFGDKQRLTAGFNQAGDVIIDTATVHPFIGLVETRQRIDNIDLRKGVVETFRGLSQPTVVTAPDSLLSCDAPIDLRELLPGVEFAVEGEMVRVREVSVQGIGTGGDGEGRTPGDPTSVEQIRVLLERV